MWIKAYKNVRPAVAEGVFVAETAVLIGEVELEEGSSVWYGAVLRGDEGPIRVGKGSNVQDNCVLHSGGLNAGLTIGGNVTIGHGAVVHCRSVGDNCLIGMGAVLLGGAVVGDNCVVGAGALVKENDVIPPGSLAVGVPARVVRALRPEEVERLKQTSGYVRLAQEYLAQERAQDGAGLCAENDRGSAEVIRREQLARMPKTDESAFPKTKTEGRQRK